MELFKLQDKFGCKLKVDTWATFEAMKTIGRLKFLNSSLFQTDFSLTVTYGKYPKILCTKVSNKMAYANNIDPDQTAPEGAVWL